MIRTIEVLFVILIIAGAFIGASYLAVLPGPGQVAPMNLNRLSLTTLQLLDSQYGLSQAAFETSNATVLGQLQVALAASLPANVVYNLTVYNVNDQGGPVYTNATSISNADKFGAVSDEATYTVASSNVTFQFTPQQIGENGVGGTLYILNCSDANGWWITGYTAQSLAQDLYNLLSPYFVNTIMVQNTTQLNMLLNNQTISTSPTERVQNAVIINTFGEAVPMPSQYYQGNSMASQGYDPNAPNGYGYVKYCYTLGTLVNRYNWTWASIVGYPFYYVSNTGVFANQQAWGIYGNYMNNQGGSVAFLEGLSNQSYTYNSTGITSSPGEVTFTPSAINYCNYYGIYPSYVQTSTRALSTSIQATYNLQVAFNVFNPAGGYSAGAVYNHRTSPTSNVTGSLLAIGLTRTPDIRVTALSLLAYYQPTIYPSQYTSAGTSRIVVLQLGLAGGS
jgi:hypothetical protein